MKTTISDLVQLWISKFQFVYFLSHKHIALSFTNVFLLSVIYINNLHFPLSFHLLHGQDQFLI